MTTKSKKRLLPKRNSKFFDIWSLVHLLTGVTFGWIMPPFTALAIMVLWEPLEIFVLSPILGKLGIVFGYESLKNSLSDIVFNTLGVILGAYVVTMLKHPPFQLF